MRQARRAAEPGVPARAAPRDSSEVLREAAPRHVAAVRRHFIDLLTDHDTEVLDRISAKIIDLAGQDRPGPIAGDAPARSREPAADAAGGGDSARASSAARLSPAITVSCSGPGRRDKGVAGGLAEPS
jgi:hypothetical protein